MSREADPVRRGRNPAADQDSQKRAKTCSDLSEHSLLRDWDQGRNELSAPATAPFKAIAANPEAIAEAQKEDA